MAVLLWASDKVVWNSFQSENGHYKEMLHRVGNVNTRDSIFNMLPTNPAEEEEAPPDQPKLAREKNPLPQSTTKFEFVLQGDPASRRRGRQFVIRESHRQRRWQDIRTFQEQNPSDSAQDDSEAASLGAKRGQKIVRRPPNARGATRPAIDRFQQDLVPPLGPGYNDPFDSYPIRMRNQDFELINYYFGAMSYNEFHVEDPHPTRDLIFTQATSNAAPFHGVLAFAALSYAHSKGNFGISLALMHRGESLRLIKHGIENATMADIPGLIHAVTIMMIFEHFSGLHNKSRLHLRGLKQMVAACGGLRNLSDHPRLQIVLAFICVTNVADYFLGPELTSREFSPDNTRERDASIAAIQESYFANQPPSDPHTGDLEEMSHHVRAFLDFCDDMSRLSTLRTERSEREFPFQSLMFKEESLFHHLLATPSEDPLKEHWPGMERNHRMGILIYLCKTSIDLGGPCKESEVYFQTLHRKLVKARVDFQPHLQMFLYAVLRMENRLQLENAERAWGMIQMVQVVKRLGDWTGLKVGRLMLDFLTLSHGARVNVQAVDATEIWDEVLNFQPGG